MTVTMMVKRIHNRGSRLLGRTLLCALPLASTSVLALPGVDQLPQLRSPNADHQLPRRDQRDDRGLSARAVAIAEQRYHGRAMGARHLGNGVYQVRVLQDNGKLKTVTIDAK